jgi:hypothetical protein
VTHEVFLHKILIIKDLRRNRPLLRYNPTQFRRPFRKNRFCGRRRQGFAPKMPMIRVGGPQFKERSGTVSLESSPGRFEAHTERMSKMKKSSRFWWLHGAILLSAAIGCNRNCTTGGGGCGPGMAGTTPYGGTVSSGGPVGSAGATMYSQSTPSTPYSGASAMPGGSASSLSSGTSAGYPMPNMSSSIPQGLGGTR